MVFLKKKSFPHIWRRNPILQCELCGKECRSCKAAVVDGVKMMLCPDCMRHGEGTKEIITPANVEKFVLERVKKTRVKDIYENMNKELISDWPQVIKEARIKKGLSREELGFRIGERTVIIAKIENGDLRPSDKMIEKLEKELGISLLEEVKDISVSSRSSTTTGLTIGDLLKTEKK
ncbi:MAG: TIGR00270 family protein [Thermoplasmata archaeon]|nr:MAG: TIGR00270 family protein [Thermoplasmata archaeon]